MHLENFSLKIYDMTFIDMFQMCPMDHGLIAHLLVEMGVPEQETWLALKENKKLHFLNVDLQPM